jgi:hypothetical protein
MSLLDSLLYGYRTIRAETVDVTQRGALNFSSAFTTVDNALTKATDIGLAATQAITTATITTLTASVLRMTSEDNALTGSQNNVTIGNVLLVRVTDGGTVTWTGIAADSGRRWLLIQAVGAGGVVLAHENASSTAINRFALISATNVTIPENGLALVTYDPTLTRWLLVARSS